MSSKEYRILVVDDSSVMRKAVAEFIQSAIKAVITEAEDGEAALAHYKPNTFDLVTLDVNMPKLNGIEVLKKILEMDKKAKVIMLTTEAEKNKIIEAVSLGANSYIVKPIDKEKTLEKIKNALEIDV